LRLILVVTLSKIAGDLILRKLLWGTTSCDCGKVRKRFSLRSTLDRLQHSFPQSHLRNRKAKRASSLCYLTFSAPEASRIFLA